MNDEQLKNLNGVLIEVSENCKIEFTGVNKITEEKKKIIEEDVAANIVYL